MSDRKTWFEERAMPILKTILGAVVGDAIGKRRGNGLLGAGIGIAATRLATRSIPGALLVGGAFVAKKLYDKRKAQKAISPSASTPTLPPANP
jgi:hypothetical protein